MFSGLYLLVLVCDHPSCSGWHWGRFGLEPTGKRIGRRLSLEGEHGDALRARAVKAGWLLDASTKRALCPKCAKGAG